MEVLTNLARTGECKRCGECCEAPTKERVDVYKRAGYGCKVQHLSGCPWEKRVDGKITCTDYDNRPKMCRDFPLSPLDIAALPNCGFKFAEGR